MRFFVQTRRSTASALFPYTTLFRSIHDATLQSFVNDRLASSVCATTINRTLEVVRAILVRAARSYRHPDGEPWLDRKSTRLNSSHVESSYAVFCLKKKRREADLQGF